MAVGSIQIYPFANVVRMQQHRSGKKLDMMRKYCSVVARRFMVLCGNMTLYGTFSLLDKNVCQTILSARFFKQPTLRLAWERY